MPNGGSDCCGTCWFNSKNEGESGYHGSEKEGKVICQIRDIEVDDPFYTYCINHPHHNPDRIKTPLGPVYAGEERQILIPAPDDQQTRNALLQLLENMDESPTNEYPFGRGLDEEVIVQIGHLMDKRAVPFLKRIVKFNPSSQPEAENPFNRDRIVTIGLAAETLAKISQDEAIPEIEKLIVYGLNDVNTSDYEPKEDKFAAIRYHAVRGLKYCNNEKAIELLKLGLQDPHQEIKAFSKSILENKIKVYETENFLDDLRITNEKAPNEDKNNKSKWWEFWKKNQ